MAEDTPLWGGGLSTDTKAGRPHGGQGVRAAGEEVSQEGSTPSPQHPRTFAHTCMYIYDFVLIVGPPRFVPEAGQTCKDSIL